MEVYTPIRPAPLRPVRRATQSIGKVVLVLALLVVAAGFVRSVFGAPSQPGFRNFGVVHTSIGIADVACGGEASGGCGVDTALRFESCSAKYLDYFDASADPATVDRQVRELTGKRPPSGDLWVIECGDATAMIQGQPLAKLASD